MDTNEPPTTEVDWNEKSLHPPLSPSPDILDLAKRIKERVEAVDVWAENDPDSPMNVIHTIDEHIVAILDKLDPHWHTDGKSESLMQSYFATGNTQFSHNGDFSGDVRLSVSHGPSGHEINLGIDVPMTDLLEFVGEYIRRQAITRLENMNNREIIDRAQAGS